MSSDTFKSTNSKSTINFHLLFLTHFKVYAIIKKYSDSISVWISPKRLKKSHSIWNKNNRNFFVRLLKRINQQTEIHFITIHWSHNDKIEFIYLWNLSSRRTKKWFYCCTNKSEKSHHCNMTLFWSLHEKEWKSVECLCHSDTSILFIKKYFFCGKVESA